MKKFIFILSLLAFQIVAFAQTPDFYFTYNYPDTEAEGGIALETDDGCFLVSAFEYMKEWFDYEDYTVAAKILKLSATGEMMGEMMFGEEGRRSTIVGLFSDPKQPGRYLAVGKIHDNELHCDRLLAYKFDRDLQTVWQKEIEIDELDDCFFCFGRSFMDAQGNIVYMTLPYEVIHQPQGTDIQFHPQTFFKISSDDGTLLAFHESEQPISLYLALGSIFEFKDGSGDYGHVSSYHHNNAVVRMNSDFEIIDEHPLPFKMPSPYGGNGYELYFNSTSINFPTVLSQPDSSLVIIWEADELFKLPEWRTDMTMLKIDIDGNIIASQIVGFDNDSVELAPYVRGVDRHGDWLYFCHSSYTVINDEFHYVQGTNLITVTKTDSDLGVVWQRYCHLNMNCRPLCITATKDGGCLVTGGAYCEENNTVYVLAFKVLADGTLSCPETEISVRPYAYYPNPANDQLRLQYSPDVKPAQIELYDLQGRLVRSQGSGLECLNLQGLAAGQYVMKVTMADGTTFSDKVVKE